jgi:hypothetical protein
MDNFPPEAMWDSRTGMWSGGNLTTCSRERLPASAFGGKISFHGLTTQTNNKKPNNNKKPK